MAKRKIKGPRATTVTLDELSQMVSERGAVDDQPVVAPDPFKRPGGGGRARLGHGGRAPEADVAGDSRINVRHGKRHA